jgi:hypothetical protein
MRWYRELAAFTSLYGWAVKNKRMTANPVAMRQLRGLHGEIVTVPAARAKDSRPSNAHWLTPRTWTRWIEAGLRGNGRDGAPGHGLGGPAGGPQRRVHPAAGLLGTVSYPGYRSRHASTVLY